MDLACGTTEGPSIRWQARCPTMIRNESGPLQCFKAHMINKAIDKQRLSANLLLMHYKSVPFMKKQQWRGKEHQLESFQRKGKLRKVSVCLFVASSVHDWDQFHCGFLPQCVIWMTTGCFFKAHCTLHVFPEWVISEWQLSLKAHCTQHALPECVIWMTINCF